MHSFTYVALLAVSVAAQSPASFVTGSSVVLFNFFLTDSTLTQIGADATATTYVNNCTAGGISVLPSSLRPAPDATITPAPTPPARLARQASPTPSASASNEGDDGASEYNFCEPYTLKQGPSTWEFHLTDPLPGAWTAGMNCNWQGAITDADLTCTVTQSGYVPDASVRGVQSSVLSKGEISSMELISPVAIVTQTPTGSSSAAGAARSTGLGPAAPMPTGGILFVGSVAGVFAAALAL